MPRHSDFEKLYRGMIKQYGKEKGERVYYSFVNKHKLDDTKPMPEHLPKEIMEILTGHASLKETEERFDWLDESIKLEGDVVRGHAIHADIPTANKVTYTEEELRHAARTLKGKNLFLNHLEGSDQARDYLREKGSVLDSEVYDLIARIARRGDPVIGEVIDAEYRNSDTRAVEYAAKITDPDALRLMKAGKVVGVSVGATPRRTIEQNGTLPVGVYFDDLSLVTAPERPGDPEATVKLWEKLREMAQEPSSVTVNAPGINPEELAANNGHAASQAGPTRNADKSSEGGSKMQLTKEDLEAITQNVNKGFQESIKPVLDAQTKIREQNNGVEERLKGLEEAFKGLKSQGEEMAGKFHAMEYPEPTAKQEEALMATLKEAKEKGNVQEVVKLEQKLAELKKLRETKGVHREGILGVPGQEPDLTGQGQSNEEDRPLATFSGVMSRLTGRKQ